MRRSRREDNQRRFGIADELPRLLDGVARHETHIVVEQDGQPVAAIIAIDEFRRIEQGKDDLDSSARIERQERG